MFLRTVHQLTYTAAVTPKMLKQIKATKLPGNPASVSYTYSIWIYVNSWQYRYGQVKQIFYRSARATPNPSTYYQNYL